MAIGDVEEVYLSSRSSNQPCLTSYQNMHSYQITRTPNGLEAAPKGLQSLNPDDIKPRDPNVQQYITGCQAA